MKLAYMAMTYSTCTWEMCMNVILKDDLEEDYQTSFLLAGWAYPHIGRHMLNLNALWILGITDWGLDLLLYDLYAPVICLRKIIMNRGSWKRSMIFDNLWWIFQNKLCMSLKFGFITTTRAVVNFTSWRTASSLHWLLRYLFSGWSWEYSNRGWCWSRQMLFYSVEFILILES